jgi:hypothetical protein
MFKKNNTNIILALCISGVLIALAFYKRHAASSVPVEAFYVVIAAFFLLRRKVCKKQCGA